MPSLKNSLINVILFFFFFQEAKAHLRPKEEGGQPFLWYWVLAIGEMTKESERQREKASKRKRKRGSNSSGGMPPETVSGATRGWHHCQRPNATCWTLCPLLWFSLALDTSDPLRLLLSSSLKDSCFKLPRPGEAPNFLQQSAAGRP